MVVAAASRPGFIVSMIGISWLALQALNAPKR
jgi:hypothetical protein